MHEARLWDAEEAVTDVDLERIKAIAEGAIAWNSYSNVRDYQEAFPATVALAIIDCLQKAESREKAARIAGLKEARDLSWIDLNARIRELEGDQLK